jgi:hypothetical protein
MWKMSASGGPTSDIANIIVGSVSVDPPNILAGSMADVTATLTGVDVASNWMVFVSPQSDLLANLGVASVRVSADNQITIRFANPTLLAINQGSVTMAVLAIK